MSIDCQPIVNALTQNYINNLPILDLGTRKGMTGYIDFIQVEEMDEPVMKGIDIHRRPFIAIKCNVTNGEKSFNIVGTFFQRYSDYTSEWAFGTCYNMGLIYNDSRVRVRDYDDLNYRLKKLFSGCIVESYDNKYQISLKFKQSLQTQNGG
jgi:hypothetical protein